MCQAKILDNRFAGPGPAARGARARRVVDRLRAPGPPGGRGGCRVCFLFCDRSRAPEGVPVTGCQVNREPGPWGVLCLIGSGGLQGVPGP